MPSQEYEIVHYDDTNFKISLVSVDVGPLHMHREMELSLLLFGECRVECLGKSLHIKQGDMWMINSMKSHQTFNLYPNGRSIVLHLQIKPDFFQGYYPEMDTFEFPYVAYNEENLSRTAYCSLVRHFMEMGICYFKKEHHSRLMVAGLINLYFYELLENIFCEKISKEAQEAMAQKVLRMRFITDYINEHYMEPLYLTDIADKAALSMSRLSHIFKESFGISFQEYLAQIRCQHARELLEETDKKLLDICLESGFSDPKYFNRDFKEIYNVTPKEYRRYFQEHRDDIVSLRELRNVESAMQRSVIFHMPEDSVFILEHCMEEDLLKLDE